MAKNDVIALTSSRERAASTMSGYAMLVALVLVIALQVFGIANLANDNIGALPIASVIVGPLLLLLIAPGFYMLQPNQAVAITLFGDYRGTDRVTGLRWTWPWMGKKKVSVRANNFISDKIKVNDLRGNPIEMALTMLSEKKVVELDDERRAAMVSNLMVVLCGERDTQPVVNAGSLYQ